MTFYWSQVTVYISLLLLFSLTVACDDEVIPPIDNSYQWRAVGLQGTQCIRIVPDDGIVFICAGSAGLWSGSISDSTWEYLGLADSSLPDQSEYGVTDVVINSGNPSMMLCLLQPDSFFKHGVYKTLNEGLSWQSSDSGLGYMINGNQIYRRFYRFSTQSDTVFGMSTDVYRSSDFGAYWSRSGTLGSIPGRIFAVAHSSAGEVWVGGENNFFGPILAHSTDGARSWDYIELAGTVPLDNAVHSILVDPVDEQTIYLGMQGAVIKSTDRGKSWIVPLTTDQEGHYFRAIESQGAMAQHLWMAAGDLLVFTADGGGTLDTIPTSILNGKEIYDMQYDPQTTTLLLATSDGLWKAVVK